jgi:hypothetical protein
LSGGFSFHFDSQESSASYDELRKQLEDLEVASELPEQARAKISKLYQRIEKAEIEKDIIDVKNLQEKGDPNEELKA